HIIVDNGPGALLARPGPAHQTNGVVDDIVGHGNAPYQMLYGDDPLGVEQGVQGHLHIRSGGLDHLDLLGQGRVIQFNGEHETIELGLGQGVGTLLLYWVLGGQYKIGPLKLVAVAPYGDGLFLHGLQKGSLGLGRGPVDFIGQDDVPEYGAFDEFEIAVLVQDLTAQN